MNSGIQVFSNQEFSVRTMRDADGTLWFVAKDVAQALEYSEASNPARLFQSVPEIWRGVKRIHTPGGEQEMLCLTEQGLYFFLGRSDKPKALPYQMWIAGEVVPSIHATGSYSVKNEPSQYQIDHLNLERAKFLQHIIDAPAFPLSDESKAIIQHEAFKMLTGHECLSMLPVLTEQWYTAEDIGRELGITGCKVGRIANQHGLKPELGQNNEYGRWTVSKSRHSSKECPQFIYTQHALDWFKSYRDGTLLDA